jgi:hypothetical protein
MEYVVEAVMQDEQFYQEQLWPLTVALIVAGVLSYLVGVKLDRPSNRRLVDPETQEEVVVNTGSHSLFFIKMQWWGPILFLIGVGVFVYRVLQDVR